MTHDTRRRFLSTSSKALLLAACGSVGVRTANAKTHSHTQNLAGNPTKASAGSFAHNHAHTQNLGNHALDSNAHKIGQNAPTQNTGSQNLASQTPSELDPAQNLNSHNPPQNLNAQNAHSPNTHNPNAQGAQSPHSTALPLRTLGRANPLQVSALAFGCMGLNYHRSKNLSEREAARITSHAVDMGINFFDTAQVYGPNSNEILVGKILKPYRHRLIIATKFGFGRDERTLDSSPKRIREVAEQSLKRLGLECLPLFYQHRFDPQTPIESVAHTIQELIKEGKVARWGVCELGAKSIERAHAICPLSAIQSEYHLMWRNVEREILPTLERLSIGFVAYSPLARGYLSGKPMRNSDFDPKNDNRASFPRYQDSALRANYGVIRLLREFATLLAKKHATPPITEAQLALSYLLAKSPHIVPLFGTTNAEHLREDVESASLFYRYHIWQAEDLRAFEKRLDSIAIVGARYPSEQEMRVER